jgi:hypothetical protein
MATPPAKKSTETLLIDQTIGKTVYDALQTREASGLESMVVAGTNVANFSRPSKPVNVQEIDLIFRELLKRVISLVESEKRELAENLVLSLKSEAYKGDNAQVDTVEIILHMIAELGERPFMAIYEKFSHPDCPLASVFHEAACKIGEEKFKLSCSQDQG